MRGLGDFGGKQREFSEMILGDRGAKEQMNTTKLNKEKEVPEFLI